MLTPTFLDVSHRKNCDDTPHSAAHKQTHCVPITGSRMTRSEASPQTENRRTISMRLPPSCGMVKRRCSLPSNASIFFHLGNRCPTETSTWTPTNSLSLGTIERIPLGGHTSSRSDCHHFQDLSWAAISSAAIHSDRLTFLEYISAFC